MSFDEIKTGKDNPEFLNTFNQLGEVVKNNANIIKERMGIYDAFYRYFQGLSNIKIPKIVQNDKDWNDLRKVYAGKFVTDPKKKGIPLDSIYQEMAPKFPDLFSGTPDQTKQFEEIVKAVKLYQNDINGLEPVNLKKAVGWEDNMWSDLLSDIGVMREQIKAQMPQIEEEVKASAQNIKKSLMDIDVSFDSAGVGQLTEKVKGYFTSLDGISDENVKLQLIWRCASLDFMLYPLIRLAARFSPNCLPEDTMSLFPDSFFRLSFNCSSISATRLILIPAASNFF